jgi:HK97 family phage major capsid protein
MSQELIEKALEAAKTELNKRFEDQSTEVNKTGAAFSKSQTELKAEVNALQEKIKSLGEQLFTVEQKAGSPGTAEPSLSFAEKAAQELTANKYNGGRLSIDVGTFQKAIGSAATSAGVLINPDRLGYLPTPNRRMTIRSLLAQGRTASNALEYVRENVFTNNATIVPEGQLKPESNLTFTKESTTVKTIAHWVQASKQVMADAGQLAGYIDARLYHGLQLVEEAQLLNGNGQGDNLQGINTVAHAYDTSLNSPNDTGADILAHALYQVSLSEFSATGIVLNPLDWHKIALLKDKNNNYLIGGPQAFASQLLWGMPIISTLSQAAGTFTVGAFGLASQVWDRMDATIIVSDQDRDNFVKNMLTILAEQRLAVAHYRPSALIKGTFA